jgi:hypothetical protein
MAVIVDPVLRSMSMVLDMKGAAEIMDCGLPAGFNVDFAVVLLISVAIAIDRGLVKSITGGDRERKAWRWRR